MLFLKVLRVIEFLNILLVASIMPSGDTNNSTFATIVSVSIDLSGIKQGYREKQSTTANMYLNPIYYGNGPVISMQIFLMEMLLQ